MGLDWRACCYDGEQDEQHQVSQQPVGAPVRKPYRSNTKMPAMSMPDTNGPNYFAPGHSRHFKGNNGNLASHVYHDPPPARPPRAVLSPQPPSGQAMHASGQQSQVGHTAEDTRLPSAIATAGLQQDRTGRTGYPLEVSQLSPPRPHQSLLRQSESVSSSRHNIPTRHQVPEDHVTSTAPPTVPQSKTIRPPMMNQGRRLQPPTILSPTHARDGISSSQLAADSDASPPLKSGPSTVAHYHGTVQQNDGRQPSQGDVSGLDDNRRLCSTSRPGGEHTGPSNGVALQGIGKRLAKPEDANRRPSAAIHQRPDDYTNVQTVKSPPLVHDLPSLDTRNQHSLRSVREALHGHDTQDNARPLSYPSGDKVTRRERRITNLHPTGPQDLHGNGIQRTPVIAKPGVHDQPQVGIGQTSHPQDHSAPELKPAASTFTRHLSTRDPSKPMSLSIHKDGSRGQHQKPQVGTGALMRAPTLSGNGERRL